MTYENLYHIHSLTYQILKQIRIVRFFCALRFFLYVSSSLLNQPSYQAFIDLLDNYENVEGISETTTSQELNEQDIFLDYFVESAVGAKLYEFLSNKGILQIFQFAYIVLTNLRSTIRKHKCGYEQYQMSYSKYIKICE